MESTKNETQSNQNRRVIRKNQSESNAISGLQTRIFSSCFKLSLEIDFGI